MHLATFKCVEVASDYLVSVLDEEVLVACTEFMCEGIK